MNDFDLQRRLVQALQAAPPLHNALLELLRDRLEFRRQQHEAAAGEVAIVLRGHVRELNSLISDLSTTLKGGSSERQPKQDIGAHGSGENSRY